MEGGVIYDTKTVSGGTHILIFKHNGADYIFERKVFVPESEYRKGRAMPKNKKNCPICNQTYEKCADKETCV